MDKDNFGFKDEDFGEDTELTSQTVDWGMPGDFIIGTFIKARHGVETQFGQNSIYEFLADHGQFHKLTKKKAANEPTVIHKGEVWNVWGRNDIFNSLLNALRPGQVVKIIYAESKETKMGEAKIIKVYAPKDNTGKSIFNQEWLDSQGVTGGDF